MSFIRLTLTALIIMGAIGAFVFGMLFISHEMKPSREDYQKTVAESGAVKQIFLVNHGWHTDLVLNMDDVSKFTLPEKRLFNGKEYIAIGWGDAGFYQADEITPTLAAKALLQPTETVVHMTGLDDEPSVAFPESEVIAVRVSKRGFDKMMNKVSKSVKRYSMLSAKPLRDGLHKDSYFLRGMGKYHMFNTCNHWTAKMLKAAELPFNVTTAFSASNVMWQAQRYAVDAEDSPIAASLSEAHDTLNYLVQEYVED